MVYTRKMSPIERMQPTRISQGDIPTLNCINQFVVEGFGQLNLERWQAAIDKVSMAVPGTRLKLHGHLGFSKWIADGPVPPVTLFNNSSWDGCSPNNAGFLKKPLDIRQGPSCEIVLLPGDTSRVVFRTHHSVMDGGGTKLFMEEVFRILRGQEPLGCKAVVNQMDMMMPKQQNSDIEFPGFINNALPLCGEDEGEDMHKSWRRKLIRGKFRSSAPLVVSEVAKLVWSNNPTSNSKKNNVRLRFLIDLRRHRPADERFTGNLIAPLFVDVGQDDDLRSIRKQIQQKVKAKQDLVLSQVVSLACWVPLRLINNKLYRTANDIPLTVKRSMSGTISSLGSMPKDLYSYDDFQAQTVFAIPLDSNDKSFFLTLWENSDGLDLVLGMPQIMATNGRLDKVFKQLVDALESYALQSKKS